LFGGKKRKTKEAQLIAMPLVLVREGSVKALAISVLRISHFFD
jgi:hypothetical protein